MSDDNADVSERVADSKAWVWIVVLMFVFIGVITAMAVIAARSQ